MSVSAQQLRGEFDQEFGVAGETLTSLVMRQNIREIQVADETVRSLGRWRQRSQLLQRLLLVLLRGISKSLPVCLRHFAYRICRDGGFCCEICFFSWVRIKLGRVIRGQTIKL